MLSMADGWFDACAIFTWQIALFVSLGRSISAYGGAMALAGLVGAAFGLLIGRHVDAGHGRRAVLVAAAAGTAVALLRAASFGSPWLAVAANALGVVADSLMLPVFASATYNLAKGSPCTLRFFIVTQGGWDLGCAVACLSVAALSAAGVSLAAAILLALPALAAAALLTRRYYARGGAA
jgi:DHA1 family inner membrane transport protein